MNISVLLPTSIHSYTYNSLQPVYDNASAFPLTADTNDPILRVDLLSMAANTTYFCDNKKSSTRLPTNARNMLISGRPDGKNYIKGIFPFQLTRRIKARAAGTVSASAQITFRSLIVRVMETETVTADGCSLWF